MTMRESANDGALPFVSCVIVARNEEKTLEECMRSVVALDYPSSKKEIIYVDSNSTDRSIQIASKFLVKTVLLKGDFQTCALARNEGFKAATGDFVYFIDGDMVLDSGWLRAAIEKFKDRAVACVNGRIRDFNRNRSLYNDLVHFYCSLAKPGEVESPSGGGLFRRTALEQVGPHDPALVAADEPDLGLRLRKAGYKIIFTERVRAYHDADLHSLSQYWSRVAKEGFGEMQLLRKLYHQGEMKLRGELLKTDLQFGILCLLGITAAVFQIWWVLMLETLLLCALIGRKTIQYFLLSRNLRMSFVFSLFLYLNKIPLIWGQLTLLLQRSRGAASPRPPGARA